MGTLRTEARQMYVKGLSTPFTNCEYCGALLVWMELFNRDEVTVCFENARELHYLAAGSAVELKKATIDHIKPLRDGGTNQLINLAGACFDCNLEKDRILKTLCKICGKNLTGSDNKRTHKKCANRKGGVKGSGLKRFRRGKLVGRRK